MGMGMRMLWSASERALSKKKGIRDVYNIVKLYSSDLFAGSLHKLTSIIECFPFRARSPWCIHRIECMQYTYKVGSGSELFIDRIECVCGFSEKLASSKPRSSYIEQ